MPRITGRLVRETCSIPLERLSPRQAFQACRTLAGLARWWLRPEVLQLAHQYDPSFPGWTCPEPPALPETPGSCWVVFTTTDDLPLLRPAFLLPLCWKPDAGHSASLPSGLRLLADQVVEDVRELKLIKQEWGLRLAENRGLDDCQLDDDLEFAYGSGWAPLAAGLIARAEGLLPQAGVWASGAWDQYGLAEIDGLEKKLALAREWQAKDFFVPVWKVGPAREWLERNGCQGLEIGALAAPLAPKPLQALNQYLARLTARPPAPDADRRDEPQQFEACRGYYLHQPAFTDQERAFYWSHLLPGIIRRQRDHARADWPGWQPTHFVTIVSPSHELAVLAPLTLGVSRCLLLHTPNLLAKAEQCRDYLRDRAVSCVLRPFERGEERTAIAREVEAFTRDIPADQVVLDLKPGTKMMTYSLSRVARPGNWLVNLEAKFLDDRRNDPGTERLERWQAGS